MQLNVLPILTCFFAHKYKQNCTTYLKMFTCIKVTTSYTILSEDVKNFCNNTKTNHTDSLPQDRLNRTCLMTQDVNSVINSIIIIQEEEFQFMSKWFQHKLPLITEVFLANHFKTKRIQKLVTYSRHFICNCNHHRNTQLKTNI